VEAFGLIVMARNQRNRIGGKFVPIARGIGAEDLWV